MASIKHYITIDSTKFCYWDWKLTAYGYEFQAQNHDETQPLEYWKAQLAWRNLSTDGDDIEVLMRRLLEANITAVNRSLWGHLMDFMRGKVENAKTMGPNGPGEQGLPPLRYGELQDPAALLKRQQAEIVLGPRPVVISGMPVRPPQPPVVSRFQPGMSIHIGESGKHHRPPGLGLQGARPQIQPGISFHQGQLQQRQPGFHGQKPNVVAQQQRQPGFQRQQPNSVAQEQRQARPQVHPPNFPIQRGQLQHAGTTRPHVGPPQNHPQQHGYQFPNNVPLTHHFAPSAQAVSSPEPIPEKSEPTPLQFQAEYLSQISPPDPANPVAIPNFFVGAALSAFDEMENFRKTGNPGPLSSAPYSTNYKILTSFGKEQSSPKILSQPWDIYGTWVLECKGLKDFSGDEPLILEIYRYESPQGVQIVGTFYFEFAYQGVIRFCNTAIGPSKKTELVEYVLAHPGHVTAEYPTWCFRWRGREIGGEELIHLNADEVVHEISFGDGGKSLRGSWASDATGRTEFTGRKMEDFEGGVADMERSAGEALVVWRGCGKKAYDRLFGWEAERVRVNYD